MRMLIRFTLTIPLKIIFTLFALFFSLITSAQISIDTSMAPAQLIELFMGDGVKVFNIRAKGNKSNMAAFDMQHTFFPMDEGIMLTTGRASVNTSGKNLSPRTSTSMKEGAASDFDLGKMVSKIIYNVTVIEFDFIPFYDSLYFDYVFASEEYPEYVGSMFNDVFVLMLSGPGYKSPINLARVGEPPAIVSVNNVNHKKNADLFISNEGKIPAGYQYQVEYDGFTKLITAKCSVARGKKHHMKIAIGNVNDFSYDSGVFLRASSFGSRGEAPVSNRFILPFDFNSTEVRPEYANLFDSLATVLKANPSWKLSILGHTDSVGSRDYNDTLSAIRARETAKQLTQRGVSQKQLFVKGYGFFKPMAKNNTEEGRKKNRRVELHIMRRD